MSTLNDVSRISEVANFTIVKLGTNGRLTLYTAGSSTDVAVDVVGYIPAGNPSSAPIGCSSAPSGLRIRRRCTRNPSLPLRHCADGRLIDRLPVRRPRRAVR